MSSGTTFMKQADFLLRRSEKLRRDAFALRREAARLSLAGDRECMMIVAAQLEAGARALEIRASCPQRTVEIATTPDKS
jgi:hypothetical protein